MGCSSELVIVLLVNFNDLLLIGFSDVVGHAVKGKGWRQKRIKQLLVIWFR